MKRILGAVAACGLTALLAGCGGSSNNSGYSPAGFYFGSIVGTNTGSTTIQLLRLNVTTAGIVSGQLLPLLNGAGATSINVTGTLTNGVLTIVQPSGTDTGPIVITPATSAVAGTIHDSGVNTFFLSMSKAVGVTNLVGTHTGTLSLAGGGTFIPTISISGTGGSIAYTGGGGEAFVDMNNRLYMDYEPTAGGTGHVFIGNLTGTSPSIVLSNALQYTPGQATSTAVAVTGTLN